MAEQALSGLKVLDLSQGIAGPYCAKLLASYGAEVIKVEPPGTGDVARREGPFPGGVPHPEKSATFLYLNTGKRGITLNPASPTGVKLFKELARNADVVVESYPPGYMERLGLGYSALATPNPGLVMTSITGFGSTGPYRDYQCPTIVGYALGSYLYVTGHPDREPLQPGGRQPDYLAALHAAIGTMAALEYREETGQGQHVEASILEAVAGCTQYTTALYTHRGEIKRRQGGRYDVGHPNTILPCKDGHIQVCAAGPLHWERLCTYMAKPELLEDPRFQTGNTRREHADELDPVLSAWLQGHEKREFFAQGQLWRFLCGAVLDVSEVLEDPQYRERGFWVEADHPEAGRLTYPGAPFKLSATPWAGGRAPLLGEHNEDVYCGLLGYSRDDLGRLRAADVI